MSLKDFRTYRRRKVTRESGFKVSGDTTGGEAKVYFSKRLIIKDNQESLIYGYDSIKLTKLFLSSKSLLAFGFYLYPHNQIKIEYTVEYELKGDRYMSVIKEKDLKVNSWNSCGFHLEIDTDAEEITSVTLSVRIASEESDVALDICCDNFGIVDYEYYIENEVYSEFSKKTSLNIPHIYYFDNESEYLSEVLNSEELKVETGIEIILKSCNRCSRFLPINKDDERHTIAFSSHCVKRAPCAHSTFSNYKVLSSESEKYSENGSSNEIKSHHGHQLECKSCKKFFVNAPLNPQRNPEQFKEDGLRRRAFEQLVNNLLDKDLIHHEYIKKTKREFTEYIYEKFGGKCFKCNKKITIKEMNLDHTMPLSYLYRLDETATSLCATHNSSKNDRFPIDYYTDEELIMLSKLTGITLEQLKSKETNPNVIIKLVENVEWLFDVFLAQKDYQKIRDGIKTSDKIYTALIKVLPQEINLIDIYKKSKHKNPSSITIV